MSGRRSKKIELSKVNIVRELFDLGKNFKEMSDEVGLSKYFCKKILNEDYCDGHENVINDIDNSVDDSMDESDMSDNIVSDVFVIDDKHILYKNNVYIKMVLPQ